MKAIWKGEIIAESNETIVIERNHYFPPNSIKEEYLSKSDTHSVCAWKGTANYYNIIVGSETNKDAAWYYPEVSKLAKAIEGYVAFWKGVAIVE